MKNPTKTSNGTRSRAGASSARGSSTAASTASTDERRGPAPRSEGHRRLLALDASGAEVARAIGSTRASVSAWRKGNKKPSPEAQRALAEAYSIPVEAWSTSPTEPSSSSSAAPPRASSPLLDAIRSRDSNLAQVEELLAIVQTARRREGITPGELAKLATEERRLIESREHILDSNIENLEIEIIESIFVHKSPRWREFKATLSDILRPHKDIAFVVAEALAKVGRNISERSATAAEVE